MKPAHKVVAYLRISRSTLDEGSLARQREDIERLCTTEGWELVAELNDDGVSGRVARENVDKALAMLRSGEATCLVVWKFDRLTRQGISALGALIDTLDATPGALFVAHKDGLRSDQAAWRIIAAVLAEVARAESEAIALRVSAAQDWNRRQGFFRGARPPYGYRAVDHPTVPGKRTLALAPDEASLLRELANRIIDGELISRLVLALNTNARFNREGREWRVTTMKNILMRPSIVGRVVVSRPDPTSPSKHRRIEEDVVRDDSGEPIEFFPPVLDLDTWHRLRAILDPVRTGPKPSTKALYLLSGVVRCGRCGRAYYGNRKRPAATDPTQTPRSFYRCASRSSGQVCGAVGISARLLEPYVTEAFLKVLGDEPYYTRTITESDDGALAEVEADLRRLGVNLANATDDAHADAIVVDMTALRARRNDLRASHVPTTETWTPTGQTVREVWEAETSIDARRRILQANLAAIVITPEAGDLSDRLTLIFRPAWQPESGTPRTPGKV